MTSSRLEAFFKAKRSVLFFELVCFQNVVFPPMKAASYTSGTRGDKIDACWLEKCRKIELASF